MSTTIEKPFAATRDGYTQTERWWSEDRDTGASTIKNIGEIKYADVGVQVDGLPVTAEAFTGMEHLTPPQEI
jgi:hypothetical protein